MSYQDGGEFGKRQFYRVINLTMTDRMLKSLEVVAGMHGVPPAFMARTMLMVYLDQPTAETENFAWRDNRNQAGMPNTVYIGITNTMNERANHLADRLGISRAQLARNAIARYLSRHPVTRPVADAALRESKTAL